MSGNTPSKLHDLTLGQRSQTIGIGTFDWSLDHMVELTGRPTDDVIVKHKAAAE